MSSGLLRGPLRNRSSKHLVCEEALQYFHQFDGGFTALCDVPEALFEQRGDGLSAVLRRRCRHVLSEHRRVRESSRLLEEGQLEVFGRLLNASRRSLKDDYEVNSPELDALVEIARETEEVLGARMTGAGFGGCTVSLARREAVPALEERMRRRCHEGMSLNSYVRRMYNRWLVGQLLTKLGLTSRFTLNHSQVKQVVRMGSMAG